MKLKINLELTQNDTQGLKGEDLDNEIESQIEDMELEGWEVSRVDIVRGKEQSAERKEDVRRLFQALFAEIENPATPAKINSTLTKQELFGFWMEDLNKLLK